MTDGEHVRTGLALPGALDEVHVLLEEVAAAHGVDPLDLMRLETALVELVANIIEHGRPEGEVRYGLRVDVDDERLTAHLWDDAIDVAPEPGGAGAEADVWAESGRGMALAGAVVDELVHRPNEPGNCWRLRQGRTRSSG